MGSVWKGEDHDVKQAKAAIQRDQHQLRSDAGLKYNHVSFAQGKLAWFLERSPAGEADSPPLVILPGNTVDIDLMGANVSHLCRALPSRRILIVELPYHGRNSSPSLDFDSPAPSIAAVAKHLEELRRELCLEEPFDLFGYSLGGAAATLYASLYPDRVRRLLLLAPYFFEATTDEFAEIVSSHDWRNTYGWETFEEMCHYFHRWLGLSYSDAPPEIVLRGIHAIRKDKYVPRYWSAFLEALEESSVDSDTFLSDRERERMTLDTSTLLLCGEYDAVCDASKLRRVKNIFKPEACELRCVKSGHAFGPGGLNIFEIAFEDMKDFFK